MLLTQQQTENESGALLKDILSEGTVQLCEKKSDGCIRVEGEFGRWDKPTANKRMYPKNLWESNIDRLRPSMKNKKVLGELDHPSDGKTSLKRASHVITNLWLESDGRVMGEAEIVPTRLGKDLEALFRSGVPIGISSRGYGSTKPNNKGEDVVQSDYKLVTFDFVAEPADGTAYPDVFFEGVEFPMDDLQKKFEKVVEGGKSDFSADDLQKKFEKAVEGGENAFSADTLRKEFEISMLSRIADMKESIRDDIRQELLEDPEVAKAKTTLTAIAELVGVSCLPEDLSHIVQEKDEEIVALKRALQETELKLEEKELQLDEAGEQISTLVQAVKSAGYKYHLENLLREHEEAELIRNIVGDVCDYESTGALTERVVEIREEIDSRREEEQAEYEKIHASELSLKKKNKALAEGLEEALHANHVMGLKLYAEKRLRNHPESKRIQAVLDCTEVDSKEQIDDIIEEFRESEDEDNYEEIRNRVRKTLGGSRGGLDESDGSRTTKVRNYNGLGASLTELQKLSGI